MNRNEIMALNADGLRREIAKAKGWKYYRLFDDDGKPYPCIYPLEECGESLTAKIVEDPGSEKLFWQPGEAKWTIDIAAAIPLLDEYPEWVLSRYPEKYRCVIYAAEPDLHIVGDVFDADKCQAACRAWLLAKESK